MNRRDAITSISMAGGASLIPPSESLAGALASNVSATFEQAVRGTAPVKIRDIKTILTAPNRIRLVVVKVETTEPGLVGWGCATFTQRSLVVQTALNDYLKPFLIGRNVDEIEDIWQSSYTAADWRNGPVLFNAMSGVDIALWDIKGKRAGMPLYQLLGGKVRHGADCYYHASGASFTEVEENARTGMERGFRHVRVQVSTPGYASYGARSTAPAAAAATDEAVGPTNPRAIGSLRPTCGCSRSSSSTCAPSSARRSSCSTTSTSASRSIRASTCASLSSPIACSSSRIRSRRRTTITSGCCASRRAFRSRWASFSTRSTNTCRSSRSA